MLDLRYKTILGVALPLMTSSFIQAIVLITDSSFISRYDPTSLAFDAVGNGGLLYITVFMALAPAGLATEARIDAGFWAVVVAGLLVGIGTRYASGCTSGHGVCGLSRLSPRSLVATLSFMGAGFFIVYIVRHIV